jgi:hypothetical protein
MMQQKSQQQSEMQPTKLKVWTRPTLDELPKLTQLTLQSIQGEEIMGGPSVFGGS